MGEAPLQNGVAPPRRMTIDMTADKNTVARLLKTAAGQLTGILKMIEEDRYCVDISNQIMATESILRKANSEVLKAHMAHCVKQSFESGTPEEAEEKLEEVLRLLDKLAK